MSGMSSTGVLTEEAGSRSSRAVLLWGVLVGILQAFSPVAFWWLD